MTQQAKRARELAVWTALWVISLALATFGSTLLWESSLLSVLAVLVNLAMGVGMIVANIRYLKSLDELLQRIQLQAMALALGIGVVAGLSYSVLDLTDLVAFDGDIGFLVLLMSFTYIGTHAFLQWSYR
jgi:hypothetical protein